MKKVLLGLVAWVFVFSVHAVSAMYTPSTSLQTKVARVSMVLETVVENDMNWDYQMLINMLKKFESKVAWNEEKEWILETLMSNLTAKMNAEMNTEMDMETETEVEEMQEESNVTTVEAEVTTEMSGDYVGILFSSYSTVLPAEATIVNNWDSIMYGDVKIDLQPESTEYMWVDTYYLLTEKEASYDVDTYTFVMALENNEYLKAEFKQSTSAAIWGLPEFRSATLYGQGEEYLQTEWYTEEYGYLDILEKLEIWVKS